MRTYLIWLEPKQACLVVDDPKFQISLPDWFGRNELFLTLKRYTKYHLRVIYRESYQESIEDFKMVLTMESLIEEIKNAKLYKRVVVNHYKKTEVVDEVREFKLSHIFTISGRQFSHPYGLVNGMTFFKVEKELPLKDVAFVDDDLKEKLGCSLAKSGNYFLYGEWKFFRSKSMPAHWEARKISYNMELESVEVKTVRI